MLTTSTSSVYFNAHTSVLVQDSSNVWYYFYWGNKNTVLLEVPSDKLTDLDTFNAWLIENGAGKAGEKKINHYMIVATIIQPPLI